MLKYKRACGLVVMTPPLQGGNRWFDPSQAHLKNVHKENI